VIRPDSIDWPNPQKYFAANRKTHLRTIISMGFVCEIWQTAFHSFPSTPTLQCVPLLIPTTCRDRRLIAGRSKRTSPRSPGMRNVGGPIPRVVAPRRVAELRAPSGVCGRTCQGAARISEQACFSNLQSPVQAGIIPRPHDDKVVSSSFAASPPPPSDSCFITSSSE
jgi:hypothetical protein